MSGSRPFSPPAELVCLDGYRNEVERLRAEVDKAHAAVDNLRLALESNRTIGTALGLIMCEYRMSNSAAFDVLVRLSQNENRKVNELAGVLVQQHCADILRGHSRAQPAGEGLAHAARWPVVTGLPDLDAAARPEGAGRDDQH